jgi:3'(2'), 5'-bisphosphate nucleotidase
VLAAPARGLIWRGHTARRRAARAVAGRGADKARERRHSHPRAAARRGRADQPLALDAATDAYVDRFTRPEKVACGSALKFGLLAEGSADLYPRLGPMSEWDIAAGHAVLTAAGGTMRKLDGGALRYGQGNFLVGGFIAAGDFTPVV